METKYCKLLNNAVLSLGEGQEVRAEKIIVKATGKEEIRFSWRKENGKRFIPRPLDLQEKEWLELFKVAVEGNVISDNFAKNIIEVLSNGLK